MDPMPCILPYMASYGHVRLICPSVSLYDLMLYLIPFYNLCLLASPLVCPILTLWISDSYHTPVIPLCPLVSATKYSHILILDLKLFDLFNFFIDITPMIRSLNFLKILPCISLVIKYPIMSFVGHHSIFNSLLLIRLVMKKKRIFMCLVRFLLD